MAKGGGSKHLQARVAYLDKAAQYLIQRHVTNNQPPDLTKESHDIVNSVTVADSASSLVATKSPQHIKGLPILLTSQLRAVAQKSQIRLPQDQKRRTCKVCSTPLVEALTSNSSIKNESTGKKKPWADVRVVQCLTCGTEKRFPVGARRQKKKAARAKEAPNARADASGQDAGDVDPNLAP